MGLKEIYEKLTFEEKNITIERYKSAKFVFIVISFLFFINFYFVGANFYDKFLIKTLSVMYILLVISILFFTYFYLKKNLLGKIPNYLLNIIFVILSFIFIITILPVVLPNFTLLNFFNF